MQTVQEMVQEMEWEDYAPREKRIEMTYKQFLQFCDEDVHAEWEDGETIIFMPPGSRHQDLVTFLITLTRLFTHFFGLGTVLTAPFEMKVTPTGNAREPDILYIAKEHLFRLEKQRLTGPADLLVEVVSPESVYRDRKRKFDEYEDAGVPEYWAIDARAHLRRAEFWVLGANGRYRAGGVDKNGIYRSTVLPGFWLDVAWLWSDPLPEPQLTFAAIAGFPSDMIERLHEIAARGPLAE